MFGILENLLQRRGGRSQEVVITKGTIVCCYKNYKTYKEPSHAILFAACCIFFQYNICKKKLNSKREALKILTSDLELCQRERDIYKTKIKQLVS